MARKRKRKKSPAAPRPRPARVSTSLRGALQEWKADREADQKTPRASPRATSPRAAAPRREPEHAGRTASTASQRTLDERAAFAKAMEGVQPLSRARKRRPRDAWVAPDTTHQARDEAVRQEQQARDRLDALVGGGIRFSIERDDDYVRGRRDGSHPRVAFSLGSDTCRTDAHLDLHGLRSDEARREVVRFVRAQRSRGARRVLIIHGKGHHSACGHGVLADAVLDALTQGGGAPAVEAFSTAAPRNGGSGALVVLLMR